MVARTGLTVTEHMRRTVSSLLELHWLNPSLPVFPALQGNKVDQYLLRTTSESDQVNCSSTAGRRPW